jgi:hypothetical protein
MRNRFRNRIVFFGTLLGALFGLGIAYILARRYDENGEEPSFSTREAISVGMELVKLLRRIGNSANRV